MTTQAAMPPKRQKQIWLNGTEACQRIGCSRYILQRLVDTGEIKRLGDRIHQYCRADVERVARRGEGR